jgi:hypothetical protein
MRDEKTRALEREVHYKYVIDNVPEKVSKEMQMDYLKGIVRSIRRNYGVPLKERIVYLGFVRDKLKELRKPKRMVPY